MVIESCASVPMRQYPIRLLLDAILGFSTCVQCNNSNGSLTLYSLDTHLNTSTTDSF